MKLWLEGRNGIAGDMLVAALLDLGAPKEALDRALASLGVEGLSYTVTPGTSMGQAGLHFNVAMPHEHHHHDHEEHHEGHDHAEGEHHEHHHHHEHRHLADIVALLEKGELTPRAKTLALAAFQRVAEAEAKAHGTTIDAVHFHEVGAIDSIADIVGACVLFDALGAPECIVDGLTEGTGTIQCAHGELPVPVPAVLNVAQAASIPLRRDASVTTELVTPTGIALAATFRTTDKVPETLRIAKVGIGLGTREIGRPNTLRALLLEEDPAPAEPPMWQIVTNLDDATGETLAVATEALMAAGARDVCIVPILMKKGRPAHQIQVLADDDKREALETLLLRETPAIGLRRWKVERTTLQRTTEVLTLPEGIVHLKRSVGPEGIVHLKPELDDLKVLAQRMGRTVEEVNIQVLSLARGNR